MGHSLLHQVLLSDLVVPIMLAETPEQRSLTLFDVCPTAGTRLRPDLVVTRHDPFRGDPPYLAGVPLLVVEVASNASLARDFGAKKDLWARLGVPSYWVVHVRRDGQPELHVFERADGRYVQRARLGRGDSFWVTEPFKIELSPDRLFARLPRTFTDDWRGNMATNGALDLPAAEEEILADVFGARWPTGAEKTELENGCPVFYGTWDERDVEIAQRTYPGRIVLLDQEVGAPGTLRILPSGELPVEAFAPPPAEEAAVGGDPEAAAIGAGTAGEKLLDQRPGGDLRHPVPAPAVGSHRRPDHEHQADQ